MLKCPGWSCWILKVTVTKTTLCQSQQSQFPSQHILDTELVPFEGCLTVSTALLLPITGRQSRRAGGRERRCKFHFHDPARLSEWWKSAFPAEHWAPSTRSPVDTSLFRIICGGKAPLRLSLDWAAARMIKRDFAQEEHLEVEHPEHVTPTWGNG